MSLNSEFGVVILFLSFFFFFFLEICISALLQGEAHFLSNKKVSKVGLDEHLRRRLYRLSGVGWAAGSRWPWAFQFPDET